ncbi:hypothetical protein [Nitrobacter sp. JJSN]|uniref:hypothetical protein n=1 Tax=Nitrobacter sp. JJSN TaxID=3453033 RepID=UPI003F767AA5
MPAGQGWASTATEPAKDKMAWMSEINEERVVWNEVFHAETFDFRSQINFRRYDECIFVKCTLLMDAETEQIAFTGCTFKDCNMDSIDADEARGIVSKDNMFERPLDEQRKDFEERLAAVLSQRMPKPS